MLIVDVSLKDLKPAPAMELSEVADPDQVIFAS